MPHVRDADTDLEASPSRSKDREFSTESDGALAPDAFLELEWPRRMIGELSKSSSRNQSSHLFCSRTLVLFCFGPSTAS